METRTENISNDIEQPPERDTFILRLVTSIAIICSCCCLYFGALGIEAIVKFFNSEQTTISEKVDQMMRALAEKRVDDAYDMFSTRARRVLNKSDVNKMVEGINFAFYDGYLSIEVDKYNFQDSKTFDPNIPQGTIAEVRGVVHYENGTDGTFISTLENEDGEWKIFNIDITVPPEKYDQLKNENGSGL